MKQVKVIIKPTKKSIREIIGNKLTDCGNDWIRYMSNHEILFWRIGMILTALGFFFLLGCDVTEFFSFGMIAILAIAIPSIGWMMQILFIIPCGLLLAIGYFILHPLESLCWIIMLPIAAVLFFCMLLTLLPFGLMVGG